MAWCTHTPLDLEPVLLNNLALFQRKNVALGRVGHVFGYLIRGYNLIMRFSTVSLVSQAPPPSPPKRGLVNTFSNLDVS